MTCERGHRWGQPEGVFTRRECLRCGALPADAPERRSGPLRRFLQRRGLRPYKQLFRQWRDTRAPGQQEGTPTR